MLYLYATTTKDTTSCHITEAAVILASGHLKAKQDGCHSQYGRLSTIAAADFEEGIDMTIKEQSTALLAFLKSYQILASEVDAIVLSSSSSSTTTTTVLDKCTSKISMLFKGKAIIHAIPEDTVQGGCLLSAAELDSCKQYLKSDNAKGSGSSGKSGNAGWKVHYLYAVGDGWLARDVRLDISTIKDSNNEIQKLYQGGIVYKRDYGPPLLDGSAILGRAGSRAAVYKEYTYGSLYRNENDIIRAEDNQTWPMLTFLERVSSPDGEGKESNDDDNWRVVTTIHPLSAPGGAPVLTSKVKIALDAGIR